MGHSKLVVVDNNWENLEGINGQQSSLAFINHVTRPDKNLQSLQDTFTAMQWNRIDLREINYIRYFPFSKIKSLMNKFEYFETSFTA